MTCRAIIALAIALSSAACTPWGLYVEVDGHGTEARNEGGSSDGSSHDSYDAHDDSCEVVEDCWDAADDWADACDDWDEYLQECIDQLGDIERYCHDVNEGIEDCEHWHGVGDERCESYYRQVDVCEAQREDMLEQYDTAIEGRGYYCERADDEQASCELLEEDYGC